MILPMSRMLFVLCVCFIPSAAQLSLAEDWFVIKDGETAFFHGTINGRLEVEMRLTRKSNLVEGSYVYSGQRKPLQVKGELQDRSKLILEESTTSAATGKFMLDNLLGGAHLDGAWHSADGKHSYEVHLGKLSPEQRQQLHKMWDDHGAVKWIAIGDYYGCAVRETGAWCWGDALFMPSVANAGPGMIARRALPNLLVPDGVSQLAISGSRTCILKAGAMKCWQSSSGGEWFLFTPTVVKGFETDVTAIGTASRYACGLVGEKLKCWDGQAMNPEDFVIVQSGVKAASSGAPRCGLSGDSFACWTLTGTSTKPGLIVKSDSISPPAGVEKVIASDTSDFDWGTVCWIKQGSLQCSGHTLPGMLAPSVQNPTPNQFENGVSDAALAGDHGCIVKNGDVYCWGHNLHGQLGNGTTKDSTTPVTVVGLPAGARQIVVADGYSCALLGDGDIYCWGDNQFGQTGNKSSDICTIPNGKMDQIPSPCNKKPVRVRGLP